MPDFDWNAARQRTAIEMDDYKIRKLNEKLVGKEQKLIDYAKSKGAFDQNARSLIERAKEFAVSREGYEAGIIFIVDDAEALSAVKKRHRCIA